MHRRKFISTLGITSSLSVFPGIRSFSNRAEELPLIKPPRLKPGDTIGLVTPSTYITELQLREAIEAYEKFGFSVRYSPNMLVRKGYLAGTDEQRAEDLNAMFVFLEDVGEAPYRIDRMLTQLLLTEGKLWEAAGIVLGRFNDCEAENLDRSLSLYETLHDRLSGLGIPVLYGLSFGHIDKNLTLPFGIRARLDTEAQTLTLLETTVL